MFLNRILFLKKNIYHYNGVVFVLSAYAAANFSRTPYIPLSQRRTGLEESYHCQLILFAKVQTFSRF